MHGGYEGERTDHPACCFPTNGEVKEYFRVVGTEGILFSLKLCRLLGSLGSLVNQ